MGQLNMRGLKYELKRMTVQGLRNSLAAYIRSDHEHRETFIREIKAELDRRKESHE